MDSNILCISALFALPIVLAISCYKCEPDISNDMCSSGNINITNCAKEPDMPLGLADACIKLSLVMNMGSIRMPINIMGCGIRAGCPYFVEQGCNYSSAELPPEVALEKCEAKCCYQDKCNGLYNDNTSNNGRFNGTSFVVHHSFTSVMALHAAVFIYFFFDLH